MILLFVSVDSHQFTVATPIQRQMAAVAAAAVKTSAKPENSDGKSIVPDVP